jgi:hypothetical protein
MSCARDARCRSMAARFSVMKGIATLADVRALRGNEMKFCVEQMSDKHKVAALGFYRCAGCCCCCCCFFLISALIARRWMHAWVNCAARRRMSKLIDGRRTHHRLLVAFNSLKHQGDRCSVQRDMSSVV